MDKPLIMWLAFYMLILMAMSIDAQIRPPTFAMRKLAFSTNQFGLDLYRAHRMPENEGMVFCPFCISISLAMVLLGAQGRSANALQQALYIWGVRQEDVHIAFHDLLIHLRDNLQVTPGHHIADHLTGFRQDYGAPQDFEILLFNSIYVQREYSILYHYQKFLHSFYNTSVHPLDFSMYGEESRMHINAIVEKQTKGKIKNILSQPLPKTTSVLLLNALSFDGILDPSSTPTNNPEDIHRLSQFSHYPPQNHHQFTLNHAYQSTHSRLPPMANPQSFYTPSFAQVLPYAAASQYNNPNLLTAPTRTRQGGLRHGSYDYLGCTGVEIPFRSGLLSLVLLIPNESSSSIGMLETRLNAQHITDILSTMQPKHVILEMPHIALEDSPKNLTQALFRSGLVDLFTPGFAELVGMSDFRWLHITNLIHKINVNIKNSHNLNQQQTAPASGQETIHMNIQDKPFLFFIIDNISGLALAMGKMANRR